MSQSDSVFFVCGSTKYLLTGTNSGNNKGLKIEQCEYSIKIVERILCQWTRSCEVLENSSKYWTVWVFHQNSGENNLSEDQILWGSWKQSSSANLDNSDNRKSCTCKTTKTNQWLMRHIHVQRLYIVDKTENISILLLLLPLLFCYCTCMLLQNFVEQF